MQSAASEAIPGNKCGSILNTDPHTAHKHRFGRCPARAYMEKLLPIVRARRWPFASIITHRLPLSEGAEAYRMFEARQEGVIKVVLDPWA